jgi:hypothetical protein
MRKGADFRRRSGKCSKPRKWSLAEHCCQSIGIWKGDRAAESPPHLILDFGSYSHCTRDTDCSPAKPGPAEQCPG